MYLLGYVSNENRLYLGDKEMSIVSFELSLSVLEYQTTVMRKDFETADQVLPKIPKEQRTRVAHFLEKQVRTFLHFNPVSYSSFLGLSSTSISCYIR
jgi:coatomer subunit beta'